MTQQADGSYAAKWGSQRGIVYRSDMKPGKERLFLCFFFKMFFRISVHLPTAAALQLTTSLSSIQEHVVTQISSLLGALSWTSSHHPHGPENPLTLSGVRMDAGGQHLVVAMTSQSAFQWSQPLGGNSKRSCSGVLDDVGSGTLEPVLLIYPVVDLRLLLFRKPRRKISNCGFVTGDLFHLPPTCVQSLSGLHTAYCIWSL